MPASLEGLDNLLAMLREVEVDLKEQKQVHKDAGQIVLGEAKLGVNSRTHRLERSGRVGATKKAGVIRFGGARVPYAGPYHFGDAVRPQGGFMRPDPFLYDALDHRGPDVVRRYEEHVQRVLKTTT